MSTELIVCILGDSRSGPATRWPYRSFGVSSLGDASGPLTMQTFIYTSGQMMLRNMAITGAAWTGGGNNVDGILANYVQPMVARKTFSRPGARPKKWLLINAGGVNSNYTDGVSVASAMAAQATVGVTAKNGGNGFDYYWMISHIAGGTATAQANRDAANALVQDASWLASHGVDHCLDLGSAAHGQPANLTDPTYFLQETPIIHQAPALDIEMAAIFTTDLNALLATI